MSILNIINDRYFPLTIFASSSPLFSFSQQMCSDLKAIGVNVIIVSIFVFISVDIQFF